MNKIEAGKLLSLLMMAIPGTTMDGGKIAQTAEVWSRLFARYDYALTERAALRVLESHRYNTLPAPAKLLDALKEILTEREPDALSAWAEVLHAIHYIGRYSERQALASMGARTAYVVQRMGWESLCDSEIENTSIIRAQFTRLYEQSIEHTPDVKALPRRRTALTDRDAHQALAILDGAE